MSLKELFATFPQIETSEYILRELCEDDLESIFSIYNNEENAKFVTHHIMKTKSEAKSYLERALESFNKKSIIRWGIARKEDNLLLGVLSLHTIDEWDKTAQIGYLLDKKYWRKGITSKCVSALVSYIFEDTFIEILEAAVDPINQPSIDFIKKIGFKKYRIRLGYHLNRATNLYENRFFYRLTQEQYFSKQ